MSLLLALEEVIPPAPEVSAKVGGDDVPRIEVWERRKAKKAEARIEALLEEAALEAPVALAVEPAPSEPDWAAYLAELVRMERELSAQIAERQAQEARQRRALAALMAQRQIEMAAKTERQRIAQWEALLNDEDEELLLLL